MKEFFCMSCCKRRLGEPVDVRKGRAICAICKKKTVPGETRIGVGNLTVQHVRTGIYNARANRAKRKYGP